MITNDMITSTNSKHNVSTASGRSCKMQDGLPREYFWGCKLDKENQFCTWTHKVEDDKTDSDYMQHNLFLRHAVLGTEATEERNIVTVETKDFYSKDIVQPLLSLQRGVADMCQLDINFSKDQDMVLRLTEGRGPVYITAQHLVEYPREVSTDDEITENEEDEPKHELKDDLKDDIMEDLQVRQKDGIIEEVRRKTIKRKASAAKAKSKREKLDVLCDDDEEEDEEDAEMSYDEVDEDDEDDEEDEEDEEEDEDEEEEESDDEVMMSPQTKYLGTKKVKSSQLTINGKKKKTKVAVKESKKPKIVLKVLDPKPSSGKKVKKMKK